eukprot:scaffold19400_cov104-Isochrysis_galbana.AAC.2
MPTIVAWASAAHGSARSPHRSGQARIAVAAGRSRGTALPPRSAPTRGARGIVKWRVSFCDHGLQWQAIFCDHGLTRRIGDCSIIHVNKGSQ